MSINSVSTYGSLQTLLQNMSAIQNSLNDAQVQLSSGDKSQSYDGISSSVQQLTSVNSQLTDLGGFQSGNNSVIAQMNVGSTVLGQIESLATSIKSLVATQMSGVANAANFAQDMNSDMSSLVSLLNTTYGGNFLFGGTDLSSPPVKTDVPNSNQIGQLDANYYQGSSQDVTFRISSSQTVKPNVRADNTAFQQLFAGIRQALAAVSGPTTDVNALKSAQDLIDQGIQGVTNLQASMNSNVLTVQQQNTQYQSVQVYLQGIVTNLSSADEVAVSTQVAQDSTILQAAFAAFARISQLTLSSYLHS